MVNRTSRIERLLAVKSMATEQVIALLRMKNLLSTFMTCPHCNLNMRERFRGDVIDKVSWVCFNARCPKPLTTLSIRNGSFFAKFRLSLADVWTVILMWCENESVCNTSRNFGICRPTIKKIYEELRSIVAIQQSNDPVCLGGPGIVCQIDESLFSHKQKYHRGRATREPVWVFGIVDTSFKFAKGYMEIVSDRSANTLLPIINRVCRPGTVIYSDEWAAYRQIQERLGFSHETVNHSLHFVDPLTGVHTQNIESYWARQKQKIKAMKGVRRSQLPALLAEFVWKDNAREMALLYLIGLLRVQ